MYVTLFCNRAYDVNGTTKMINGIVLFSIPSTIFYVRGQFQQEFDNHSIGPVPFSVGKISTRHKKKESHQAR